MEMDCKLKIFFQVPPVNFVEIAKKETDDSLFFLGKIISFFSSL